MSLNLITSPLHLNTYGQPTSVEDLHNHQLIALKSAEDHRYHWRISDKKMLLKNALQINNSFMLLEAVLCELGIANVYSFFSDSNVKRGDLVRVLTEYPQDIYHVSSFYLQPRQNTIITIK